MIDIHHHLLFATDDGPKDIESSVAQAEVAAAEGITHIACTPHANETWEFNPEKNLEKLEAIRERIGDSVTLGLGCDFHLSYENIEDALQHPTKFTINEGKYLLVEFAEFMIPQSIGDTFYEFTVQGDSADHHASGAESDIAEGPPAHGGMDAQRVPGADHGVVAGRAIWAARAGAGVGAAGEELGALCGDGCA